MVLSVIPKFGIIPGRPGTVSGQILLINPYIPKAKSRPATGTIFWGVLFSSLKFKRPCPLPRMLSRLKKLKISKPNKHPGTGKAIPRTNKGTNQTNSKRLEKISLKWVIDRRMKRTRWTKINRINRGLPEFERPSGLWASKVFCLGIRCGKMCVTKQDNSGMAGRYPKKKGPD